MGLLTFKKKENQEDIEFNIKHLFVLNTILFISIPMSSFPRRKEENIDIRNSNPTTHTNKLRVTDPYS